MIITRITHHEHPAYKQVSALACAMDADVAYEGNGTYLMTLQEPTYAFMLMEDIRNYIPPEDIATLQITHHLDQIRVTFPLSPCETGEHAWQPRSGHGKVTSYGVRQNYGFSCTICGCYR